MIKIKPFIKGKCPKCEKGKVFSKMGNIFLLRAPKMNESCSECSFKFDREPGFFFGAMYVSYGLTVFEALIIFFTAQLFVDDFFTTSIIYWVIAGIVLLMYFNFRWSRTLWIYLFGNS